MPLVAAVGTLVSCAAASHCFFAGGGRDHGRAPLANLTLTVGLQPLANAASPFLLLCSAPYRSSSSVATCPRRCGRGGTADDCYRVVPLTLTPAVAYLP
jgi:hypothetical protein